MANHQELELEWTMLDSNYDNWTANDLQLAAELGRTLLERNEELENELKSQQNIIEDQGQEIAFLTKQITSMKDESSCRTKVYEQLETSLADLERNNSDLSRTHELDKKRIQSMCENIDYLEKKCEELSGTLESIRDSNKKHYNGKINQSGYFNFGSSDSSEDDSGCGYGFRRRSQSLQELREYSPSPDDLDSNHSHSNSPDLKTSEAEFVGTLEARVEELIGAKKKEVEQITLLDNQLRIVIQENANLQQKLVQVTCEKNEQIEDLRMQLLDQSLFSHHFNNQSIFPTPITSPNNTRTPNHTFANYLSTSFNNLTSSSSPNLNTCNQNAKTMCKRCSTEINILNMVNSIEVENEDYSSLEFEMARADDLSQKSYQNARRNLNNFESSFEKSIIDCLLEGRTITETEADVSEEDACLVKDFGPEVFVKSCDDSDLICRNKKLKLPAKIPAVDMYSNVNEPYTETEDQEDGMTRWDNSSVIEPIINMKKRTKLWWLAWVVLLVLGIMEFMWAILKVTFFLVIAAIMPKSRSTFIAAAAPATRFSLPLRASCRKVN